LWSESRTSEIARGTLISDGKHNVFAQDILDFARPAGRQQRKCVHYGSKDSLARAWSHFTAGAIIPDLSCSANGSGPKWPAR